LYPVVVPSASVTPIFQLIFLDLTAVTAFYIFRKWEGVVGTGWSWLRIGRGGGHL